ncbi:hypothetical protein BH18ACI2_BH18ACI2_23410 [soil metagenome]
MRHLMSLLQALRLCHARPLVLAYLCLMCGAARLAVAQEATQPAAPNANQAASPSPQPRARRIRARKSVETKSGSQVSITAEGGAIKDYLSYRSGERFYVVLPKADAEAVGNAAASGRGFEDAQVQKRGQDVVLSFKLQPGATARVAQQGKNLAVVFDAPATNSQGTNSAPASSGPPRAAGTNLPSDRQETRFENEGATPTRRDSAPILKRETAPPLGGPVSAGIANEPLAPPATAEAAPAAAPLPQASLPPQPLAQPSAGATNPPVAANASPPARSTMNRFWPLLVGILALIVVGLMIFMRRRGQQMRAPFAPPTPHTPVSSPAKTPDTVSMPVEAVRVPVAGRSIAPAEETPAVAFSRAPVNGNKNDERPAPPVPAERLTLVRPPLENSPVRLASSAAMIQPPRDGHKSNGTNAAHTDGATVRANGAADSFAELCAGFDDEGAEARNATARALYRFGNDPAESFSRAMREADTPRRRRISQSISASGLAAGALSDLRHDGDKSFAAFSLLFLMAKAGEFAPLLQVVEKHEDEAVRLSVVKLLGLCVGQPDVLVSLRRIALRATLPPPVQTAVMEAIYQLNKTR